MNDLNQQLTKLIHELIPEAGLNEPYFHSTIYDGKDSTEIEYDEPLLRHVLWALHREGWYVEARISSDNPSRLMIGLAPQWVIVSAVYDLQFNLYGQTKELKEWLLSLLTKN